MAQPIPALIERQERIRTEAMATIDSVLQRCNDDDRDPTEVEEATLTDARQRLERAESVSQEWVGILESTARADEQRAQVQGALARSAVSRPDGIVRVSEPDPETELQRLYRGGPGEYMGDYVQHLQGRTPERLQRAVANQLVADNLGIVPTPIVGPVVNLIAKVRPTVSSVANRPLPGGGRSFTRPKITQHTTVGPQATEKTELASQKMTIDPLAVNKATYGGTLDISFQDRDWTEPAILQIVIDDLATVYGRQTNAAFATYFKGAATVTRAFVPPIDGPKLTAWIAGASATINAATGMMPDTVWVSPDVWAQIAGVCDTTGRPLFPQIGATNAAGNVSPTSWSGNIYGLNLVVDSALGTLTMVIGVAALAEFYETIGGQLSVTEPSILGFLVAYYGYVAWVVTEVGGFVKATGLTTLEAESAPSSSAGK